MKLADIGVYIITLNEEKGIEKSLESVKWAEEIIIVDSNSRDNTREIAKKYTDKVFIKEFYGYGEQKNYALSLVSKPWALNIDADEVISEKLIKEIEDLGDVLVNGFYIPRRNYYLGKPIRYCGWYPDYKLRLHRRDKSKWSNSLVHESLMIEGEAGYLYNEILHFTYNDIYSHIERLYNYAKLSSEILKKKKKKIYPFQLILIPFLVFFKKFIIQLGFLEGYRGVLISMMESYYSFLKYAMAGYEA